MQTLNAGNIIRLRHAGRDSHDYFFQYNLFCHVLFYYME